MRIFTVNGHQYAAPARLGEGYDVMEYETNVRFFLASYPDFSEGDEDTLFDDAFAEWKRTERTARQRDVAVYAAFLTPIADAPPIDEMWYMEAEPADMKPIKDFFEDCLKKRIEAFKQSDETGENSPSE